MSHVLVPNNMSSPLYHDPQQHHISQPRGAGGPRVRPPSGFAGAGPAPPASAAERPAEYRMPLGGRPHALYVDGMEGRHTVDCLRPDFCEVASPEQEYGSAGASLCGPDKHVMCGNAEIVEDRVHRSGEGGLGMSGGWERVRHSEFRSSTDSPHTVILTT